MKILTTFIAILFLATSSFAAEITETEVKAFLNDWLAAQNTGSYSKYAEMYSASFTGIRRSGSTTANLDHDAWLQDRKKMFRKKMVVKAVNPVIEVSGQTASVRFEQFWETDTYKDKGDKLLKLAMEKNKLRISREEMLFSDINGEVENSVATNLGCTSRFTSLKDTDCKGLSKNTSKYFSNRGLERSECSAPKGWRLFTVGGEYYWLEIAHGTSVWSTEDEVVTKQDNRFGNFQSIAFEKVEWRMAPNGEAKALIFPVVAQDEHRIGKSIIRYFVIKLTDGTPRFCGVAKSSHAAREITDKLESCNITLPQITIKALAN